MNLFINFINLISEPNLNLNQFNIKKSSVDIEVLDFIIKYNNKLKIYVLLDEGLEKEEIEWLEEKNISFYCNFHFGNINFTKDVNIVYIGCDNNVFREYVNDSVYLLTSLDDIEDFVSFYEDIK